MANQNNAYRATPTGATNAYNPDGSSTGGANAYNHNGSWQANLGLGSTQPNNDETVAYRGGSKTFNESSGGFAPSTQPAAQPTGYDSYTPNPYLGQMAQGITQQMNDNWTRNLAPSIRSGAMVAGGFGGSRQGVVEANGLKDLNLGLSNSLANLYGTDYNNAQNRNFNYAQLDSSNAQFGANYGLNALNAQNTWANNGVNAANQMQNTPIDYNRYFTGNANQIAGQGGTTTSTQNNQGNPYMSAIGGAITAGQLYKAF